MSIYPLQSDIDKPFCWRLKTYLHNRSDTVVTGRIERGIVKVGDQVEIVGFTDEPRTTVVTGIEMFRETLM